MSLSFYRADSAYCDFLRKVDSRVPYTSDDKQTRPFVGVLVEVNQIKYYAPLTSPKPKHSSMKNQVDFLKINEGTWGAINFNNMIPIHDISLTKVDIDKLPVNTKADIDYKNLLSNQLSWCNSNRETIIRNAHKLYEIIINGKAFEQLSKRCCNFKIAEQRYNAYLQLHNKEINNDILTDKPLSIKDRMAAATTEAARRSSDRQPSLKNPKDIEK